MDGRTHRIVGTAAGATTAAIRARNLANPWHVIAETIGGGLAGYGGGACPDVLEPAIHSFHRSTAHSLSLNGALLAVADSLCTRWENGLRLVADNLAHERRQSPERWTQALYWIGEVLVRVTAGVLSGFIAGQMSHVALDSCTPRSIPLFCSGF
jgi:membrane-bound metal-dependent hydrolase YbcI (DUF457 family)